MKGLELTCIYTQFGGNKTRLPVIFVESVCFSVAVPAFMPIIASLSFTHTHKTPEYESIVYHTHYGTILLPYNCKNILYCAKTFMSRYLTHLPAINGNYVQTPLAKSATRIWQAGPTPITVLVTSFGQVFWQYFSQHNSYM